MNLIDDRTAQIIQSKIVSKPEFDFDHLFARPLYSLLQQQDIDQLYYIATSARLSGNARKRYAAIADIMHARGFHKISSGTNRIAYGYYEDPSIVVKVAADKTGIMDNPREFVNQHKLKPFCTKIFEVDPTGVVSLSERVKPINSREEYSSIAADMFEILDMLTGKYLLADVGTEYFMNSALRDGFGPVLLDFPYLYEVNDANALVCKKPDNNSPIGICGGLIDYDAGFNNLVCNKCGKIYRAQEIGSYLKTEQVITKGNIIMDNVVKISFVRDGKFYEKSSADNGIMKAPQETISHPEKTVYSTEKNKLKISFTKNGVKNEYEFDPTIKSQDNTEYKFDVASKKRRNNNDNNRNQNNNKPEEKKAPYARFVKVNQKGHLLFSVVIAGAVQNVVVDPNKIPDDVKKTFIRDYEELYNNAEDLTKAKADIIKLEEENSELKEDCEKLMEMNDQAYNDIKKLTDKNNELTRRLKNIEESNNNEVEEDSSSEVDSNDEVEESEDNEYFPENSIIVTKAVYSRLDEFAKYTGNSMPEETDIDPESEIVALRFDDGQFLADDMGNIIVGMNPERLDTSPEDNDIEEDESDGFYEEH